MEKKSLNDVMDQVLAAEGAYVGNATPKVEFPKLVAGDVCKAARSRLPVFEMSRPRVGLLNAFEQRQQQDIYDILHGRRELISGQKRGR